MSDIYHIITRRDWEAADSADAYVPTSLEHEGFVHCSWQWQILGVANSQFRGQKDLLLLRIDTERVLPEIRSEDCYNLGQLFPHVYGPIDKKAVTEVIEFPPNEDGTFSLPPSLN